MRRIKRKRCNAKGVIPEPVNQTTLREDISPSIDSILLLPCFLLYNHLYSNHPNPPSLAPKFASTRQLPSHCPQATSFKAFSSLLSSILSL